MSPKLTLGLAALMGLGSGALLLSNISSGRAGTFQYGSQTSEVFRDEVCWTRLDGTERCKTFGFANPDAALENFERDLNDITPDYSINPDTGQYEVDRASCATGDVLCQTENDLGFPQGEQNNKDSDGDSIPDIIDIWNERAPLDTDGDGTTDDQDRDIDGDGIDNTKDERPLAFDAGQIDTNFDLGGTGEPDLFGDTGISRDPGATDGTPTGNLFQFGTDFEYDTPAEPLFNRLPDNELLPEDFYTNFGAYVLPSDQQLMQQTLDQSWQAFSDLLESQGREVPAAPPAPGTDLNKEYWDFNFEYYNDKNQMPPTPLDPNYTEFQNGVELKESGFDPKNPPNPDDKSALEKLKDIVKKLHAKADQLGEKIQAKITPSGELTQDAIDEVVEQFVEGDLEVLTLPFNPERIGDVEAALKEYLKTAIKGNEASAAEILSNPDILGGLEDVLYNAAANYTPGQGKKSALDSLKDFFGKLHNKADQLGEKIQSKVTPSGELTQDAIDEVVEQFIEDDLGGLALPFDPSKIKGIEDKLKEYLRTAIKGNETSAAQILTNPDVLGGLEDVLYNAAANFVPTEGKKSVLDSLKDFFGKTRSKADQLGEKIQSKVTPTGELTDDAIDEAVEQFVENDLGVLTLPFDPSKLPGIEDKLKEYLKGAIKGNETSAAEILKNPDILGGFEDVLYNAAANYTPPPPGTPGTENFLKKLVNNVFNRDGKTNPEVAKELEEKGAVALPEVDVPPTEPKGVDLPQQYDAAAKALDEYIASLKEYYANVTDPSFYTYSPGGKFGYLCDQPTISCTENWLEPGGFVKVGADGQTVELTNAKPRSTDAVLATWDALRRANNGQDPYALGWRVKGPYGQLTNPAQLKATIQRVKELRKQHQP